MVTVVIELTVEKPPKYKDGVLVELEEGNLGYVMQSIVHIPEIFKSVPIQDDEIAMFLPADITAYFCKIELANGKEIFIMESQIKRVVKNEEQDVSFLRAKIKQLEAQLSNKED